MCRSIEVVAVNRCRSIEVVAVDRCRSIEVVTVSRYHIEAATVNRCHSIEVVAVDRCRSIEVVTVSRYHIEAATVNRCHSIEVVTVDRCGRSIEVVTCLMLSQSARSRALASAVESPTTRTAFSVWDEMKLARDTMTSSTGPRSLPGNKEYGINSRCESGHFRKNCNFSTPRNGAGKAWHTYS